MFQFMVVFDGIGSRRRITVGPFPTEELAKAFGDNVGFSQIVPVLTLAQPRLAALAASYWSRRTDASEVMIGRYMGQPSPDDGHSLTRDDILEALQMIETIRQHTRS